MARKSTAKRKPARKTTKRQAPKRSTRKQKPTPVEPELNSAQAEAKDLLQYATPRQREALELIIRYGSLKAAGALGDKSVDALYMVLVRARRNRDKHRARRGDAPEFDLTHKAAPGMVVKGTSIRYGPDGQVDQYWNKTRQEGAERDEVTTLPDPKKIVKVSTLYDNEGRVTQQWVGEKPEDHVRERLWKQYAEELSAKMPKVRPQPAPKRSLLANDLCAAYPIGDHHMGMLAWKQETTDSWDIDIAKQMLRGAVDYLLGGSPACALALIVFLGDFMHYDSFEPVTPTSRHQLDADGRYPKMVAAAIHAMRYTIESALRRHGRVHVIIEIGNHDLSSSIFLMECLKNIYENEPRITIDTSPKHYHYFRFGKVLIGTHHGHGAKMETLPLIMATDVPEDWGATSHRYIWTGHVHHSQKVAARLQKDHPGVEVESFRILAPGDAYSHQSGYRSKRDMKSIILHREFGEVGRNTVRPEMLELKVTPTQKVRRQSASASPTR